MAEVLVLKLDDGREVPVEELGFVELMASDAKGTRYALLDRDGEKLGEICIRPGKLRELLPSVKAEASDGSADAS